MADRPRADHRRIGTHLLLGLAGLDQDRAGRAFRGYAVDQRIGAVRPLQPDHVLAPHHRRLTLVAPTALPRRAEADADRPQFRRRRLEPAIRADPREQLRCHIGRSDDAETLGLELLDDGGDQAVVAQQAAADMGEEAGRAPVRHQLAQGRAVYLAGEDDLFGAGLSQLAEGLRRGAEPDPVMGRIGDQTWLGLVGERDDVDRAPGFAAFPDQ